MKIGRTSLPAESECVRVEMSTKVKTGGGYHELGVARSTECVPYGWL